MQLEPGVNSYVSLTEVTAYFADPTLGLSAQVISLASEVKTLVQATRSIDAQLLHGTKLSSTQTLAFPRYYQTVVPQVVKEAQLEEAVAIAQYTLSERKKIQLEGVKSITVGKASETYDESLVSGLRKGKLKSPLARQLLRPFLLGTSPIQ
jgi:rRNA-processing protein FCF1